MATTDENREKVFGFILPPGVDTELIRQSVLTYLAVIFMVMIFVLVVYPRFADLVTAQNKVDVLAKQEATLNGALTALDSISKQVDPVTRDLVFMAIPSRFDPGLILLSLRKLASDNQVSLITYDLSGGKVTETKGTTSQTAQGQLTTHLVDVAISGTAQNLINFVDSLNRYLPIVTVKDLSLSEVSKILAQSTAELRLDMTLSYYHLPIVVDPNEDLSGKTLTSSDLDLINSLVSFNHLTATPAGTLVPGSGVGKDKLFGL